MVFMGFQVLDSFKPHGPKSLSRPPQDGQVADWSLDETPATNSTMRTTQRAVLRVAHLVTLSCFLTASAEVCAHALVLQYSTGNQL